MSDRYFVLMISCIQVSFFFFPYLAVLISMVTCVQFSIGIRIVALYALYSFSYVHNKVS